MKARVSTIAARLLEGGAVGLCLGGGHGAAYVALPDDVIAVTEPGLPELPCGLVIPSVPEWPPGTEVSFRENHLIAQGSEISWTDADIYDPTMPRIEKGPWLSERARFVNDQLEPPDPRLAPGVALLDRAIRFRSVDTAIVAADELTGRGPGMTPEGDDMLTAAAAVAFGLGVTDRWRSALVVKALGARTTSLSASLLRHALDGATIKPLIDLFSPDHDAWKEDVETLMALGHSTGRAYLRASMLMTNWEVPT